MHENKLKEHLEDLGARYNAIMDTPSFCHYLRRRKEFLKNIYEMSETDDPVIVDLAAGTGNYSEIFTGRGRLLNMDLSLNSLKSGKTLRGEVSKINADALHIPLKSGCADIILLIGALHHIPDRLNEVFLEMKRVLKTGGRVIIDEPNGYNLFWFVYMKLCEIDRVGARPLFPCALQKLALSHGLRVEKRSFWGFVPPGLNLNFLMKLFQGVEKIIEPTFLSCLCSRFLLVLRK